MPGSILNGLALDATLTGGTQKTQSVDGAGNVVGSLDCTGIRGHAVAQAGTHYAACPGSTTTAQLAAGATFTGTVEYIMNQQAISVIGVSDQPLTVTVRQFIDAAGTQQISSTSFSVAASAGFARVIPGAGNYMRITVRNDGVATTTTLAVDTVAGTLQSQTQTGDMPVRVVDQIAAISIAANATSSGSILGLSQANTAAIQLTGTWVGTLQVQVTLNGTTWVNITGTNLAIYNVGADAYVAGSNLTTNGIYVVGISGVAGVRVISTTWTSGTVVGVLGVSSAVSNVTLRASAAVQQAGAWSVNQGGTWNIGTLSALTAANLNIPGIVTDLSSAALAAGTTNSATITPTFGCSYVVGVVISAVSGTNPVLDIVVQESDDTAATWRDVYHFPRISATGQYRSPKLPFTGNRIRYVQTVGGTATPTVTRVVNRLQCSDSVSVYRQLFDRAVSLTTLNATTASLDVSGCSGVMMAINLGAATTAPTLVLEASEDNGASWFTLATLLGVASSTVQVSVPGVSPLLVRARVSVVGATVTAGYVLVRGY